jgi:hypothetical protein
LREERLTPTSPAPRLLLEVLLQLEEHVGRLIARVLNLPQLVHRQFEVVRVKLREEREGERRGGEGQFGRGASGSKRRLFLHSRELQRGSYYHRWSHWL